MLTGASRGLGAATAAAFGRHGAQVALLSRTREGLDAAAAATVREGGGAMVIPCDVRDRAAIGSAVTSIVEQWGRIDVLVNGAGIKRTGAVEATSQRDVDDTLAVNYLGALACCQAVIPVMRRQGAGRIINVSSVLGKRGTPYRGAYSASKAALNALTESLRVEMMGTGITVSLICPGRLEDAGDAGSSRHAMPASRAAERIVLCALRPKPDVVLTLAGNVLWRLNAFWPGLVDRILKRARDDDDSASAGESNPD